MSKDEKKAVVVHQPHRLAPELVESIFTNLSPIQIMSYAKTCKSAYELLNDTAYWQVLFHHSKQRWARLGRASISLFCVDSHEEHQIKKFFCRSVVLLDQLFNCAQNNAQMPNKQSFTDLGLEIRALNHETTYYSCTTERLHFRQSFIDLQKDWPIKVILKSATLLLDATSGQPIVVDDIKGAIMDMVKLYNLADYEPMRVILQNLSERLLSVYQAQQVESPSFVSYIDQATAVLRDNDNFSSVFASLSLFNKATRAAMEHPLEAHFPWRKGGAAQFLIKT